MPRGTVSALVESLSHDMVCGEDDARTELAGGEHTFLPLDEALRRSLSPVHDGTEPEADPQAPAPTDPGWSGGSVTVRGSRIRQAPRTVLAAMLLGARSRRAERIDPDRLV